MKRFLIIALLAFTVGIFAQCGEEGATTQPCAQPCAVAKPDLETLKNNYKTARSEYIAARKSGKDVAKAKEAYKAARAAYKAAK